MTVTGDDVERRRGRDETEEERADRMWVELIQEVRVAQTGVQILFGFLLTVVFQQKYATLGATDKTIYIVTVVLGATATGALIGPVSLHRLVSGRPGQTPGRALGLPADLRRSRPAPGHHGRLAAADPEGGDERRLRAWLVAVVVLWYVLCWFVLPLWTRRRYTSR